MNKLYKNITAAYRDEIVRQACYFEEVCDDELNKKHIAVTLFSLHICVREQRLKIVCEKGAQFVSRCSGLLLENFRVIARSFDKLQKLINL